MNLRASYSKTLVRPITREIAPFESFDPLEKFFDIGNPDIQKTNIDNIDLRKEWFYIQGNGIALSGYYKNFEKPITQQYRNDTLITTVTVSNGTDIKLTDVKRNLTRRLARFMH